MQKRFIIMFFLLTVIVSVSYYGAHHHPWIHIKECLEYPEKYDGKLVTDYDEPTIGEIDADGFMLVQRQIPTIRVFADTTGLIRGEYIGMHAIFHKEGYLEALSIHMAKNREEKIWVSIPPVLFVGFLFILHFRFNFRKLQIELRKHA